MGLFKSGETIEKTIYLNSSVLGTKIVDVSLITTTSATELSESTGFTRSEEFEATSVIPIMSPFGCSSRVVYSSSRLEGEQLVADATVSTSFGGNRVRGIQVESLKFVDAVSGLEVLDPDGRSQLIFQKLDGNELKATSLELDPFITQSEWLSIYLQVL